jgi:hypothetical protein
MALWTDVIDPATLTGYARASLEDYEQAKGTLAQFLPNETVSDVVVRFVAGSTGLVPEAKFRAFDAEPEIGKAPSRKRVTLELPALGQNIPVSEYEQLRLRNASDDAVQKNILKTTRQVVQAVADRIERLRGTVLVTGKATISGEKYTSDDDFGRNAAHTVTAGTLWTAGAGDPLGDLTAWADTYVASNGVAPGALLMSTRVLRAMAANAAFKLSLANGGSRPATIADVNAIVEGAGLPPIVRYDRQTASGKVVADNRVLLLPAPVGTDAPEDTELGATFWGQTLTSTLPEYGIEDSSQPGVVAGVYRNEKPPAIAEVISDAIALPVLANADLSFAATVL